MLTEAFCVFFEKNYSDLLRLAVMLTKDVVAAQDVVQNVALKLLNPDSEISISQPNKIPAYVSACIRNEAYNYLKHSSRCVPVEDPVLNSYSCASSAELSIVEWESSLKNHLAAYSPEIAEAFIAHYLYDEPLSSVADRLNLPKSIVSNRFSRIKKKLKAHADFTV